MNSIFSGSKLLAVALCGVALAGCNAVENVQEEPTYGIPTPTVVLGGTIAGISSARPVILEDRGTARCDDPNSTTAAPLPKIYCTTSVQGTQTLRLGSIAVGTPYNVVVKTQPYGKVCSIANGAGVAPSVDVDTIAVTCVRSAIPLYTLTATISAAARATPGIKIRLTTEDGVEIHDAFGLTSITFTNPVFNSGTNFPLFTYTVSAFTESPGAAPGSSIINNCNVTNPTGTNPPGNVPFAAVVGPPAIPAVPAPNVTSCTFTVTGVVNYSTPPGGTAQAIGAGMTLGLKNNDTSAIIETVPVVPGAAGVAINTVFPTTKLATAGALYELVVATQPANQFCTVDAGGTVSLLSTAPANATVQVRCRNTPVLANQLAGTFQLTAVATDITTCSANPCLATSTVTRVQATSNGLGATAPELGTTTITTTKVGAAAPTAVTVTSLVPNNRNFLTFFANGSFLYGTHAGTAATGVENGFYAYDPIAATITFTLHTDSNSATPDSFASGISGTPGQNFNFTTFASSPVMTSVVKTTGMRPSITGTFGPAATFVTPNRAVWTLTAPISVPGTMQGSWVTTDSKRVWTYASSTSTTIPNSGMHAGVNGAANLQDKCMLFDDDTQPVGFFRQQPPADFFNPGSCLLGTFGPADVPTTTSGALLGFVGRMPGLQTLSSATVSPVNYVITAGTPDTLEVQDTLNGVPVRPPVVFKRLTPNF